MIKRPLLVEEIELNDAKIRKMTKYYEDLCTASGIICNIARCMNNPNRERLKGWAFIDRFESFGNTRKGICDFLKLTDYLRFFDRNRLILFFNIGDGKILEIEIRNQNHDDSFVHTGYTFGDFFSDEELKKEKLYEIRYYLKQDDLSLRFSYDEIKKRNVWREVINDYSAEIGYLFNEQDYSQLDGKMVCDILPEISLDKLYQSFQNGPSVKKNPKKR